MIERQIDLEGVDIDEWNDLWFFAKTSTLGCLGSRSETDTRSITLRYREISAS